MIDRRGFVRFSTAAAATFLLVVSIPACMVSKDGPIDSRLKTDGASKTVRSARPADRVERLAQITITPAELDFGEILVGSETRKTLTLSNATGFAATVVQVTFDRACFLRSTAMALPLTIPPQSAAQLEVMFRPIARGECSGRVLIEVDSAAGRIREAAVKGVGM